MIRARAGGYSQMSFKLIPFEENLINTIHTRILNPYIPENTPCFY
jgi:hypothetical protein